MNMTIAKEDNKMRLITFRKIVLPLIGVLAVVALVLNYGANTQAPLFLNDDAVMPPANEAQSKVSAVTVAGQSEGVKPVNGVPSTDTKTNETSNTDENYPTIIGSPLNQKIIADWHRSRGYYVMNNFDKTIDEYASFDMDTLRQLKEAGDLRAHSHYMRKLSDGTKEGYFKMHDEAMELAARGSIEALDLCGLLTKSSGGRHTGVSERQSELDSLVWYKTAELRGSRLPMIGAYSLINAGGIAPLSKAEWQQVDERAQELYQTLLKKRKEMGLGDFDNSVPAEVQKFFRDMGGDMYYND